MKSTHCAEANGKPEHTTLTKTSSGKGRKSSVSSAASKDKSERTKIRTSKSGTRQSHEKRPEGKDSIQAGRLSRDETSRQHKVSDPRSSVASRHEHIPPKKRKQKDRDSVSASSTSNITKARRRKKKDNIGSQRSLTTSMTEDTYNFNF
jgi:hypothetical protein